MEMRSECAPLQRMIDKPEPCIVQVFEIGAEDLDPDGPA
jgi:hypothetical protein